MWVVKYYLSGGTRVTKQFKTLHDATMFCIHHVGFGQVDRMYLNR